MSNNYENKYSLSAIIQLLNPDNTISAHRMLLFSIELTIINQRVVIAAHGIFGMEKANVQVIT